MYGKLFTETADVIVKVNIKKEKRVTVTKIARPDNLSST